MDFQNYDDDYADKLADKLSTTVGCNISSFYFDNVLKKIQIA